MAGDVNKICAKKTKRRSKALKAKINKIKSADLTERFNQNEKKQLKVQSISDTNITSIRECSTQNSDWDSSNTSSSLEDKIVNDLKKNAYDFLSTTGDCCYDESDDGIPNLRESKHSEQTLQGMHFTNEEIHLIIENALQCLSTMLRQIIRHYQILWAQETLVQVTEDMLKLQQLENESIQYVQIKFDQLVNHIKNTMYRNLAGCLYILEKLERLLLGHKIREKSIFGNRYYEQDYCSCLKYMYELFDKKMEKQMFKEHPDLLYLREILALPPKRTSKIQEENNKKITMENSYHLVPSILEVCNGNEENIQRMNKIFDSRIIISKWNTIMFSLQDINNSELFLNGDLKLSSFEKKDSHLLARGGNFGVVELGLDMNNRAVAIKRIPKNQYITKILKTLLNPLIGIRNTNLLHYFFCHYEGDELFLATPLCEYNIGEYMMLMKHTTMLHLTPIEIVKQFLAGLRFLHNRNEPIIHGNLKPSNVFIDLQGVVRVGEFGIHPVLFSLVKASSTSVIWFARETLAVFKQMGRMKCTCSSDIQVAGMLIHFILSAGCHPYGKRVDDILKNVERSVAHLNIIDLDLHDLISWMLLYDPLERPTINQVLSHVFFWSLDKKWRFILACAGVGPHGSPLCLPVRELHLYIDVMTAKEDIRGSWIWVTKQVFGHFSVLQDEDDSVSGLLRFIRLIMQHHGSFCSNVGNRVRNYVLTTFPALPLSLYRILESSMWMQHRVLQPFANVDSLSA